MTTKYQRSLDKIKNKIADRGVRVEYYSEEAPLLGQAVNRDNRVTTRHHVAVIFTNESLGRDGFKPSDYGEAILAGDAPVQPKPGDYLITPLGRRYSVSEVVRLEPDGVPLRYTLRLIDG